MSDLPILRQRNTDQLLAAVSDVLRSGEDYEQRDSPWARQLFDTLGTECFGESVVLLARAALGEMYSPIQRPLDPMTRAAKDLPLPPPNILRPEAAPGLYNLIAAARAAVVAVEDPDGCDDATPVTRRLSEALRPFDDLEVS